MKKLLLLFALGFSGLALGNTEVVTFDAGQWLAPFYEEMIAQQYSQEAVASIRTLLKYGCSVSITLRITEGE